MSTEKKRRTFHWLVNKLIHFYQKFHETRNLVNDKMYGKYTPHRVALLATLGIILIWFLLLMVTPAHGLADDGSFGDTINRAGLSYIQKDADEIYNNYFIRTYAIESSKQVEIKNAQDVFLRIAIMLDEFVKKDNYFDIRFLAFLYGILYFLAFYRLVKSICRSMYYFSEAMVMAIISVLIFGDISYLAYFNSFYPEALWMIGFLFMVGAICELRYKKESYLNLLVIGASAIMLCMTRRQCGIIAFIVAAFFLSAIFINRQTAWKTLCITLAFLMSIVGVISINTLESDFTLTSKYHSMTKGVLFQASNPEEALQEFGINPSYSVLANTSAYNYYPFVLPDSKHLQEGFLDQYDAFDISLYYLKHPDNLIKMLDLSIKDTINLRRNYSGNFEQSKGMPKMAQSIMWSSWSFFKQNSMPKTIGFFLILLIASLILYGKESRKIKGMDQGKYPQVMYSLILLIVGIGISQAVLCIIMSGATEFDRRAFLMGAAMDMMLYLLISVALPKMNILEEKEEA